jgi:hypothetical protein
LTCKEFLAYLSEGGKKELSAYRFKSHQRRPISVGA